MWLCLQLYNHWFIVAEFYFKGCSIQEGAVYTPWFIPCELSFDSQYCCVNQVPGLTPLCTSLYILSVADPVCLSRYWWEPTWQYLKALGRNQYLLIHTNKNVIRPACIGICGLRFEIAQIEYYSLPLCKLTECLE